MKREDVVRLLGHHELAEAIFQVLGVLAVDLDTYVIVEASAGASKIFGYEELVGRLVRELIPADVAEKHDDLIKSWCLDPQPRHMAGRELRGLHKDGSEIPLEILLLPVSLRGAMRGVAVVLERPG